MNSLASTPAVDNSDIPAHPDIELATRVRDHLRENLDAPISVTDLAAAVFVSPRTLQRALKRAVGRSPKEEIIAVKMEESSHHTTKTREYDDEDESESLLLSSGDRSRIETVIVSTTVGRCSRRSARHPDRLFSLVGR